MTTATLGRDPFMPTPPKGRGPALVLALFAHALLIAAIAFGVHWRRFEPTTMSAELWSATPQAAAPRAVEPPTPPQPEVKKVAPVVKPPEPVAPPKPDTPAPPDPQIAIEKAKREEAQRVQAAQEEQARKDQAKIDQAKVDQAKRDQADRDRQRAADDAAKKKADADKLKADKDKADKAEAAKEKADAAKLAALRDAQLKRMLGQADATGGPTDTGSALHSSGPSASYAGRIMARIKPNIVFNDSVDGNPIATVEVKLAPDGTIVGKRLIKSSGFKSWDDAVLRAIDRTEVLPRDVDGRVPPPFQIDFRPHD
jgi:colicin import membrane protein